MLRNQIKTRCSVFVLDRILGKPGSFILIFFQFQDDLNWYISAEPRKTGGRTITGLRKVSPLSISISSVMVALMRNDWWTLGRCAPLNICRTSSSCPYDKIKSASSITSESSDATDRACNARGLDKDAGKQRGMLLSIVAMIGLVTVLR